jgi:hypothetical protein
MKVYLNRHAIISPIKIGDKEELEVIDTEYRYTIGDKIFVYSKAHRKYQYERKFGTRPEGKEISPNNIIDKEGLVKFIWR